MDKRARCDLMTARGSTGTSMTVSDCFMSRLSTVIRHEAVTLTTIEVLLRAVSKSHLALIHVSTHCNQGCMFIQV